jgi:PAS domain S-box-containing protein
MALGRWRHRDRQNPRESSQGSPAATPVGASEPGAELWRVAALESEDGIIGFDHDGRISTWTIAARRLFGYREEDIIGRPSTVLIRDEEVAEHELRIHRVLASEQFDRVPTTALRRNGMLVSIALTLAPLSGSDRAEADRSDTFRESIASRRGPEALPRRLLGLGCGIGHGATLRRALSHPGHPSPGLRWPTLGR